MNTEDDMSKNYQPGQWTEADPDVMPTGECAVLWEQHGVVRYTDGVCYSPEAWRGFVVKGQPHRGRALRVMVREPRAEWAVPVMP